MTASTEVLSVRGACGAGGRKSRNAWLSDGCEACRRDLDFGSGGLEADGNCSTLPLSPSEKSRICRGGCIRWGAVSATGGAATSGRDATGSTAQALAATEELP